MTMECIVLVHGLGANRFVMHLLAKHLQSTQVRLINWGYPSVLGTIGEHGRRFSELLEQLDLDPSISTVHIVAHSMGNIVSRWALTHYFPQKMGRMVMLAPPNRGSHVATFFRPILGKVCRPIAELSSQPDSFVRSLPTPTRNLEFGIITASRDLLVADDLTQLEGERDRIQISSWHSGILFRRDTAEQVQHFLREGKFRHPPEIDLAAG